MPTTIAWFRRDLRVDDNPALAAAAQRGAVVPVFVHAAGEDESWAPGAASRWWLHHSLTRLADRLRDLGCSLVVRQGQSLAELRRVAQEVDADAVYWNRRYEPAAVSRDKGIKEALRKGGFEARSFNGSLLWEPWEIETKTGGPYKVFTPFYRACLARGTGAPIGLTNRLRAAEQRAKSQPIDSLGLLPAVDWAGGMRDNWVPGESGARGALEAFSKAAVGSYEELRNSPGVRGTSRLSPHLAFGEVSPRRVWESIENADRDGTPYLRQLVWREFAQHLLYHFPATTDEPLRPEFARFPWLDSPTALGRWRKGQTGYPIVDAGMRELWATGWMHNRVRMIVGSFLAKDLLIPWQEGARWFWDTLVDADLGNNTMGWQWIAGCGADAAPYYRVFNPVTQGRKFDPSGEYVRRWVPELGELPDKWLHAPWEAPANLTKGYPGPIVDHAQARLQALEALAVAKRGAGKAPR